MMKHSFYLVIISLLFISNYLVAQQTKPLESGKSHTNTSAQLEWILSDEAFTRFLEMGTSLEISRKREQLMENKISTMQERIFLADSATAIKQLEATFWYHKAIETDKQLENEKLSKTKFWNSRTFWFVIGALTASAVIKVD